MARIGESTSMRVFLFGAFEYIVNKVKNRLVFANYSSIFNFADYRPIGLPYNEWMCSTI